MNENNSKNRLREVQSSSVKSMKSNQLKQNKSWQFFSQNRNDKIRENGLSLANGPYKNEQKKNALETCCWCVNDTFFSCVLLLNCFYDCATLLLVRVPRSHLSRKFHEATYTQNQTEFNEIHLILLCFHSAHSLFDEINFVFNILDFQAGATISPA